MGKKPRIVFETTIPIAIVQVILIKPGIEHTALLNYQMKVTIRYHEQENFTRCGPVLGPPFLDNLDPIIYMTQVEQVDEKQAWESGYFKDKLIEVVVDLYDCHLHRVVIPGLQPEPSPHCVVVDEPVRI